MQQEYIQANLQHWNSNVQAHIDSAFYDMPAFLQGKNMLRDIELALLGDVKGKRILHLQCHFGQDSICLARMGASVVGIDFSEEAIKQANALAEQLQVDAQFIQCDVYDTLQHINEQFDIVFTSYGTIGWLPNLQPWAHVVASVLKPAGKFVFVEFHPVMWMYDNDFTKPTYCYNKAEAIIETSSGSYANKETTQQTSCITWNHGIGEVVTALLAEGLQLTHMQEYTYAPYNCFAHSKQIAENKFVVEHFGEVMPLTYSLACLKVI
jgi:2-polyprenyl-3-methyl-5-hydroxy-6-metoxy-1,4-benzoquinol methylase